jgi:hypothetical protein
METLARHLDMSESNAKATARGCMDKWWLCVPRFLVGLSGLAVGLTLVLATLKLDHVYAPLQWWQVLLPVTITLGIVFVVFTIGVLLWFRFTSLAYTGDLDADMEEVGLDVILRTAKICFMGHAYVVLLVVSLGLLLAKLHFFSSIPVAYPLAPLMFLGMVYIILGVMLKQPEVDSPWFILIGLSVVSQSIMLIVKLDHPHDVKNLPWVAVFIPSWITYVTCVSYSAVCVVWTDLFGSPPEAALPLVSAPETTPETTPEAIHTQLSKVGGIACWAVGWGVSQALISLRLDAQHKVAWFAMALPAMIGWVLLIVFVISPISEYFEDMATLLFNTFSLSCRDRDREGYESSDVEEEQRPLLRPKRGVANEVD